MSSPVKEPSSTHAFIPKSPTSRPQERISIPLWQDKTASPQNLTILGWFVGSLGGLGLGINLFSKHPHIGISWIFLALASLLEFFALTARNPQSVALQRMYFYFLKCARFRCSGASKVCCHFAFRISGSVHSRSQIRFQHFHEIRFVFLY